MKDSKRQRKNSNGSKLLRLFLAVFKLSACTFGGGVVIVPLMRKKFVNQLGWIGEQEMLDMTAIAQSSPGAMAVNAAILVGYHVAGVSGMLLSVLGTVTPPLVIISVISFFYKAFRDNMIVSFVMAGMLCGVAAVILDVVVDMLRSIFKEKRVLPIILLLGSFAASQFFSVNIIFIILFCGAVGAVDALYHDKKAKKARGISTVVKQAET